MAKAGKNSDKTTKKGMTPERRAILKKFGWKPGQSGNPKGRPKKFISQFQKCPNEVKDKIRERLMQAMQCTSQKEAKEIIAVDDDALGEYGVVLQVAAKDLTEKGGVATLLQIYEVLFGKIPQANINVEVDDEEKRDAFIKGVFIP